MCQTGIDSRLQRTVRHLIRGDLEAAETEVRNCGDDPEHDVFVDEALSESLRNLYVFIKLGQAIQEIRKEAA